MHISVLIATYNRADNLRLCLHSYLRQSEGDFEIIVSDDGSTDETPAVVDEFKAKAPFEVRHLWREHDGFRTAEATNRGIAAARYKWLLFSDCDSLAPRDLVAVHRRAAEGRRLLCGGYIRLTKEYTRSLTPEMVERGEFERQLTRMVRLSQYKQHLINLCYIAVGKKRRPHNRHVNMSCAKGAMIEINGYDHRFVGWGNEDGDVRDRLRMIGVQPKCIYHKAIICHLWHPIEPSVALRPNQAYAPAAEHPGALRDGPRFSEGRGFLVRGLRSGCANGVRTRRSTHSLRREPVAVEDRA